MTDQELISVLIRAWLVADSVGVPVTDSATHVIPQTFHHKWQPRNDRNTIYVAESQLDAGLISRLPSSPNIWPGILLLSGYSSVSAHGFLLYFIQLFMLLFWDLLLFFF